MDKISENRLQLIKAISSAVDIELRLCPRNPDNRYIETEEYYVLCDVFNYIRKNLNNDYVSTSTKEGCISYARNSEPFDENKRVKTTFARYIRRILNYDLSRISDATLDRFCNNVNTFLLDLDSFKKKINIINGPAVLEAYQSGIKTHSCMTEKNALKMEIIALNPDKVSMLVIEDVTRALLWVCDDGTKVLDRIYPSGSNIVPLIRKWALSEGYVLRANPDKAANSLSTIHLSDEKRHFVTLDMHGRELYPYLDTFSYGVKSNDKLMLSNYKFGSLCLHSPNGIPYRTIECGICYGSFLLKNEETFRRIRNVSMCNNCFTNKYGYCIVCCRYHEHNYMHTYQVCIECFKKPSKCKDCGETIQQNQEDYMISCPICSLKKRKSRMNFTYSLTPQPLLIDYNNIEPSNLEPDLIDYINLEPINLEPMDMRRNLEEVLGLERVLESEEALESEEIII